MMKASNAANHHYGGIIMTVEQLSGEICELKHLLEVAAKRHRYNLVHPSVIRLSQQLDVLIVKYQMKSSA
jgi:hypothetical protein